MQLDNFIFNTEDLSSLAPDGLPGNVLCLLKMKLGCHSWLRVSYSCQTWFWFLLDDPSGSRKEELVEKMILFRFNNFS